VLSPVIAAPSMRSIGVDLIESGWHNPAAAPKASKVTGEAA
jgi:hypothetical protein